MLIVAFAACGGGAINTVPLSKLSPAPGSIISPSPPSDGSGVFASGGTSVVTGTVSSPVTLPTPSSGAYTFAQLAANLDASQLPLPGAAIGTVGVITSLGSNTIVVRQVPLLSQPNVGSNAAAYEQNVALVGDFSAPLTVAVDQNTVYNGAAGFAALTVGQMIIAAGTANGTTLAAQNVALIAMPSTSATATSRGLPAGLPLANFAPARRTASLGQAVNQAFTRTVGLGPALKYDAPNASATFAHITCYTPLGKVTGTGIISLSFAMQTILSPGQLIANFPYDVTYNPTPPQFTQANGTLTGPGNVTDWLNFEPHVGSKNAPTLDLTAGFALGAKLGFTNSCPGAQPTIELASGTLGYAIESNTTKAMPGPKQSVQLDAITCPGLNGPLNINLFAGASGFPNLNPLGNFSTANLAICDQPLLSGNFVTGIVGNIAGGTLNNPNVTFDPGQSGSASVLAFGTFFPTSSPLSFTIGKMTYEPSYTDAYTFSISAFGNFIIGTPYAVSPFKASFAGLQSGDVPVAIAATSNQLCATVTSGNAFLGASSMCAPQGALDFEFCRDGSGPTGTCPSEASGTSGTIQVTEGTYTGPFTVMDNGTMSPFGGGCESGVPQTYPITVSPRTATGPSATFTLSIGSQQLPRSDTGCNVYIMDASQHAIIVSIQFLSRT